MREYTKHWYACANSNYHHVVLQGKGKEISTYQTHVVLQGKGKEISTYQTSFV